VIMRPDHRRWASVPDYSTAFSVIESGWKTAGDHLAAVTGHVHCNFMLVYLCASEKNYVVQQS